MSLAVDLFLITVCGDNTPIDLTSISCWSLVSSTYAFEVKACVPVLAAFSFACLSILPIVVISDPAPAYVFIHSQLKGRLVAVGGRGI